MKKAIERVGPETVMLVIIDGGSDWTATEPMIQQEYPWIHFMHCTSHETALIVKDCFKPDGGIQELIDLDEKVTNMQHWFSSHAMQSLIAELAEAGEPKSFIWPAKTRYCAWTLKFKRARKMRDLLRRVVTSGVYVEKNFQEDPIKDLVLAPDMWELMDKVIKILGPILLLCRLADGQKPVISKLYGTQLYVRKSMQSIAAAAGPGSVEEQVYNVFLNRWDEMQCDMVSATYLLDPLFVEKSKRAASCTIKLWQVARKVSHTLSTLITLTSPNPTSHRFYESRTMWSGMQCTPHWRRSWSSSKQRGATCHTCLPLRRGLTFTTSARSNGGPVGGKRCLSFKSWRARLYHYSSGLVRQRGHGKTLMPFSPRSETA